MSIGAIRALRLLHRQFSHYPAGARVHILIRFLTCPFLRTLDALPPAGRILDIGAGHGTLARLAVEGGSRAAIALEPDLRKVFLPFRHGAIRFVAGFDDSVRGKFDAVALYDVVYRLSPDERDRLYRRAYERLAPGGVLLVKELDPTARFKSGWARLQERISDRFLGITLGEGFHLDTPAQATARLEAAGFTEVTARRIDRGYPHAHILYRARRPEEVDRGK
ncbi:MAG TPA: class I SAM-dependent methyltransferase [Thermoanaerobaculia bacterium]|nr:class I SAM-dependent methyltransferase [Thermoanaerobaculia bacterium]